MCKVFHARTMAVCMHKAVTATHPTPASLQKADRCIQAGLILRTNSYGHKPDPATHRRSRVTSIPASPQPPQIILCTSVAPPKYQQIITHAPNNESRQTKVTFVMLCMNVQLDCNVSYVIGLNVHCNRQRVSPKFKWCASRQESYAPVPPLSSHQSYLTTTKNLPSRIRKRLIAISSLQASGQRNPTKMARQSFAVGHELSARNLEGRSLTELTRHYTCRWLASCTLRAPRPMGICQLHANQSMHRVLGCNLEKR